MSRARSECQRLLTVDKRVCGGVLERGEDLVLLETGGKVLGGLRIEVVAAETATEASKGAHQNASTRVRERIGGVSGY